MRIRVRDKYLDAGESVFRPRLDCVYFPADVPEHLLEGISGSIGSSLNKIGLLTQLTEVVCEFTYVRSFDITSKIYEGVFPSGEFGEMTEKDLNRDAAFYASSIEASYLVANIFGTDREGHTRQFPLKEDNGALAIHEYRKDMKPWGKRVSKKFMQSQGVHRAILDVLEWGTRGSGKGFEAKVVRFDLDGNGIASNVRFKFDNNAYGVKYTDYLGED